MWYLGRVVLCLKDQCPEWTRVGTVTRLRMSDVGGERKYVHVPDEEVEPIRLWCMLEDGHEGEHRHDEVEWDNG